LNNKDSLVTKSQISADILNNIIIESIQDIKGKDIVNYDLRGIEMANNDFFIICHATSNTQMLGIINNIEKKVFEKIGMRPFHAEGKQSNSWMLVDYFNVVVHVFSKEKRAFYNLEDLWNDAQVTFYDNQ
jgi:ribosome-associated protein